jgi:hypothetical protein
VIVMTDDISAEELERQRRRRLIDEARAVVERLKHVHVEKRREEIERLTPAEVARRLTPACADDAVERWARDAEERERERKRAERELKREARRDRLVRRRHEGGNQPVAATRAGDDWNTWADARIAEALDRERDALAEGFGDAIAKLLADVRETTMAAFRDQVRELKIEIAELRNDHARARSVVDLPLRRVN